MRKSLMSIALAVAVVLPAAGAATVGSTAAQAAPAKIVKFGQAKRFQHANRLDLINKLALRRCMRPIRLIIRRESNRLRFMGYRNVRLTRVYQYRPRCAQHLRFTACRGIRKYEFEIRYRNGRRIRTWRYPKGRCFIRFPLKRSS